MKTAIRRHMSTLLALLASLMLVAQVDVASAHHSGNPADDLALAGNDQIIFQHLDGRELRLMNQQSGKFLVPARWGGDDSERNVQVAADANHNTVGRNKGMDWVLRPAGGGYWFIVNLTSGLYLSWDKDDSNVSTWGNCVPCGNDNLQWRFVEVRGKNDTFMIYNKASGEALDQAYHGREHNRENVRLTSGEDPNNGGWNWVFFTSHPNLSRLRVLDIESVKAIKTSEGTDAATSILFSGIDLAVQLGAAAASGGTSAAMSAARAGTVVTRTALKEAAEQALKKKIRSELRDIAGISNGDLAAAGMNVVGAGNSGGADAAPQNGLSQAASTVLNAMSSEYLFNKLYGTTPDDLDIQVNNVSIFPNGGRDSGRKIESQQTLPVDKQVIFYHDAGFSLNLIEYDSASADDNLGGITWRDSAQNIATTDGNGDDWWQGDLYKTQRYEDVVFSNEGEGSLYLVTFSVSALRPVGGTLLQRYLDKDRLAWGGGYNKAKLQAQEQDDLADAVQIRFGSYCEERGKVSSGPQTDWPESRFVIKNDSGRRLHVSRIDESGAEKPIRTIEPEAMFAHDTVPGNHYVVLDSEGNCAAMLQSFNGRKTWSISAPGAGVAIAGAGSAGGNAPGTPTATPLAADASCELRGNFATPQSGAVQAVDVWLTNTGQSDLLLYWMNYQGAETDYGSQPRPIDTLAPGARKNYPMAAGAGYLATDAKGICNAVIIVQAAGNEYALAADPNAVASTNIAAPQQNYPAFSTAMNTVADYVQAGGNSCDMRNAIASDPNAPQVDKQINLNNTGATPVLIYWLNYEGAEVNYQNEPIEMMYIAPGQSAALATYAGFAYVAVDTSGNCQTVFQADQNTDGVYLGDGSFAEAQNAGGGNSVSPDPITSQPTAAQNQSFGCEMRGQFASVADPSQTVLDVSVANAGAGTLHVFWANEAGQEGDYAGQPYPVISIAPDSTQYIGAYQGYIFTVVDDTNTCVGVFAAQPDTLSVSFSTSGAANAANTTQGASQQGPDLDPGGAYTFLPADVLQACQGDTDCLDAAVLQTSQSGTQDIDYRIATEYADLSIEQVHQCGGNGSGYEYGSDPFFACLDVRRSEQFAQSQDAQPASDDPNANGQEPGWDRADVLYQPAYEYCAMQLGLAQESAEYSNCYFAYPNY